MFNISQKVKAIAFSTQKVIKCFFINNFWDKLAFEKCSSIYKKWVHGIWVTLFIFFPLQCFIFELSISILFMTSSRREERETFSSSNLEIPSSCSAHFSIKFSTDLINSNIVRLYFERIDANFERNRFACIFKSINIINIEWRERNTKIQKMTALD